MDTVLVKRTGVTRLSIERVERDKLDVGYPEIEQRIGHIQGLGNVVEGTGTYDRSMLRIRKRRDVSSLNGGASSMFLAQIGRTQAQYYVRTPDPDEWQRVEQLDVSIEQAERELVLLKREQRQAIELAFAKGTPVDKHELLAQADTSKVQP